MELLDLWQTTTDQPVSHWRLDLPGSLPAAEARLAGLAAQAGLAGDALAGLPERLAGLVRPVQAGVPAAFALAGAAGPEPEAALLELLGRLQGEPAAFALGAAPAGLADVGRRFQAGLDRLLALLTHLAWVETSLEGRRLGHTVVGWSGDTSTAWQAGLDPAYLALHRRNLALALAGRLILLRVLVVAGQAAGQIAPLLAMPAGLGAVLALPLAWTYVNRVLAEIDRYHQITSSPGG